eukprot:3194967-Amphidinium_carterae.1
MDAIRTIKLIVKFCNKRLQINSIRNVHVMEANSSKTCVDNFIESKGRVAASLQKSVPLLTFEQQ